MGNFLTYATLLSRLHADLLVVRLKHAGVDTTQISMIHPKDMQPNSTLCWVEGATRVPVLSGESVVVAGPLRFALYQMHKHVISDSLAEHLQNLGLTKAQSMGVEERLAENRIVVTVELQHKRQLPAVLGAMDKVSAENVCTCELSLNERQDARSVVKKNADHNHFDLSADTLVPINI